MSKNSDNIFLLISKYKWVRDKSLATRCTKKLLHGLTKPLVSVDTMSFLPTALNVKLKKFNEAEVNVAVTMTLLR